MYLNEYECHLDIIIKPPIHKNLPLDTKIIKISQIVFEICRIAISTAQFYDFGGEFYKYLQNNGFTSI